MGGGQDSGGRACVEYENTRKQCTLTVCGCVLGVCALLVCKLSYHCLFSPFVFLIFLYFMFFEKKIDGEKPG